MQDGLVTIVESREFSREAATVFSPSEIEALKFHLACDPLAGVVIPGTGGVRKLRWAAKGKGKRGGGRVIYYFHNETLPLFLVAAYAKGVKENIAKADLNYYQKLTDTLRKHYRSRG